MKLTANKEADMLKTAEHYHRLCVIAKNLSVLATEMGEGPGDYLDDAQDLVEVVISNIEADDGEDI